MNGRGLIGWLVLGALAAPAAALAGHPPAARQNVLILLVDDIGVDNIGAYGLGSDLPATPVIDQLAADGVLFRNVWSNPVCSPTRVTIQTGRHGFRTGIGYLVFESTLAMQPSELTLPEMLGVTGSGYATGAFGKWHMGNSAVGGALAPVVAGYGTSSGTLGNVNAAENYSSWTKAVGGTTFRTTGYLTSDTVDDVIDWIQGAPEPWLCYVAFHAAHAPYHAPPANLHSVDLSGAGTPDVDPRPYFKAMIEALDTELGRLLGDAPIDRSDTTVIFLSDNGTGSEVTAPPFLPSHGKATVFQGGVNVPMIVVGPDVQQPGSECEALVNTTDLFATVADLAGVAYGGLSSTGHELVAPGGRGKPSQPGFQLPVALPGPVLDSVSIVPYLTNPARASIRSHAYTEIFVPNGPAPVFYHRAIRNHRYKLIVHGGAVTPATFLFDLENDPFELVDLLASPGLSPEEELALTELSDAMAALLATE